MAPRGRKPKPTHLKVVTGNPGKRQINETEPRPDLSIPAPPPHLSDEAKVEWGRVCDQLYRLKLLRPMRPIRSPHTRGLSSPAASSPARMSATPASAT